MDASITPGWLDSGQRTKPGEVVRRLNGASLEMLVVDMDGTTQTDHHSHDVEQLVVVLQGAVVASFDGVRQDLSEGDAVVIPAGVMHCLYAASDAGARVVESRLRASPITGTGD